MSDNIPTPPANPAPNPSEELLRAKVRRLEGEEQKIRDARDQRARTHIKAVMQAIQDGDGHKAAQPAGLFMSGMLTGLACGIEILDGGTAEKALETVGTRLAAAIGEAYLAGNLPPHPVSAPDGAEQGAPTDWQTVVEQRERELKTVGEQKQSVEQERDRAYRERAHLVALLAAMTDGAAIALAPDVDEPGWQILYLTLGGRQASWHISPRDAELFEGVDHVPADSERAQWDGHTTDDKYARIRQYTRLLFRQCGPACAEGHTYTGRCESAPIVDKSGER